MKTLLLLRHAKSSWAQEDLPDHDRPLNKRGKRDAPRIGQLLRDNHLVPELILSSTAKRARKTAAKVARQCGYQGVIELVGELYMAPASQYLEVLREIPDHVSLAMVVGHNPGAEELLTLLTGCTTTLPTAALARVELDVASWRQLTSETHASLLAVWRPRALE